MKEQIVEMSGLSPRVIRVWFQNKRCKDKKNQLKQEMQREKNKTQYDTMRGTHLIATSPGHQQIIQDIHGVDVIPYQPPWKALSEYAFQVNMKNEVINENHSTFQRLVNQMHGFDLTPNGLDLSCGSHGYQERIVKSTESFGEFMESDESV